MHDKFKALESKPAAQFFSYAVPAIVAMLLTSGIIIVDGLFIGNIIGKIGLASVNLSLPLLYLFLGIAIMIGVGGAVKVGHALGGGNLDQASKHFSATIALAIIVIAALAVICLIFFDLIVGMLTTDQALRSSIQRYLGTILWFYPAMMVNIVFSILIRSQGNPGLSLFFGIAGNLLNLVLDYLMIARWGMGLRGAALASGVSVLVPMGCGILYFLSKRSTLSFRKFSWNWHDMARILFNGSSELIGQLSIGFTTWVFNTIILSRMGVDGVAAYTIVGYIAFVQIMIITGLATGLGPIVGYYYGAGNAGHIRQILKVALSAGCICGAICWLIVLFSSTTIAALFTPGNHKIIAMAGSGFVLFTTAFVLNGFNILITGYFTSIGNARISAMIAAMRSLILINLFVLLLPMLIGNKGIWISYPLTELVTLGFAVFLLKRSWQTDLVGLVPAA